MRSDTSLVYVDLEATDDVVRGLQRVSDGVVTVETVAGCLANLSSASAVVVADTIPGTDPVALCERIRASCPAVPIVVFPRAGSEALAGEAIAAGADGYVPRAEGVDTLADRVGALLGRASRPGSTARPAPSDDGNAAGDGDGADGAPVLADAGSRSAPDERKRANALEALQQTTSELLRAESVDEIATIVMDATEHVIDRSLAALRFYDEDADALELVASTEKLATHAEDFRSIEPGDDPLWQTYADGRPRVIDDVSTDQLPYEIDLAIGNAVVHPLGDHGLLAVGSSSDDELDAAAINLVSVLAATAEAALDRASRERELERTKRIVETVGDSVYALDERGTLVAVNDRLTEVTGYDRDELVGSHVSMIFTTESVERSRKRVRALASADDDRIATYEIALTTRDGDRVPCEVNTTLLRTDDSLEGSAGIVRDISDRKRMERELVDRKAKIEGLHEVASQLDDCGNQSAVFELTVEAAEKVLNFDVCVADRIEGDYLVEAGTSRNLDPENYFDRIHVDDGIAGKTYRTQQTYIIDDSARSAEMSNRTDTYRSLLSAPIGDHGVFQAASTERNAFDTDDLELAELLLSHVVDALDRLAFESELREERDRFAALFENVPDAVVSARQRDGEALVESVNPAFERVFGYDERAVADRSLDDLIVPADRLVDAEALTRRGGEGEIVEAEVKRRTADGLRDFMMRVVPVVVNESSKRTFGLYTDITDRKQRQKRVEILNRVLRHDMRNGMNIIDGCAEMLADAVDDDDVEYATTIQERAGELISLAEKTRAVERILEREPAATAPIDIGDIVVDAVTRLENTYPGVEIDHSIAERTFASANGSVRAAIYQVLENAVVHNDTSTPTLEISARDRTNDGMLSISIADNGPGIPDEERELLEGDREITQLRHASGLGLWLATIVVTQLGGQLTFEPNEPRGTVVTLEVPRAEAELAQATTDSTAAGD